MSLLPASLAGGVPGEPARVPLAGGAGAERPVKDPNRPGAKTHFDGTDKVVEHVERYWCPSFVSTDVTGKPAFRFKADTR